MRQLSCFVIIPSNRNGQPLKVLHDERWGLVEIASGCKEAAADNKNLELNFDDVYEQIIQEAITDVNDSYKKKNIYINCERGQDLAQAGDILGQLLRKICAADITITDITTNNPNVFLEYGIRLAIKDKGNIMICHKDTKRPFDVEKLRWIDYSMDIKGANKAKNKIAEFITTEIENYYQKDQKGEQEKGAIFNAGSYSLFKQIVDVYTGRLHERKLVNVLMKTPKLLAKFASFYYTNKKSPKLMFELFKSFKSVAEVLKEDPKGQLQAIEHLEIVSKIEGLSKEKLQETYIELSELCDTDPNLKNKAQYYLKESEKIGD